VRTFLQLVTFAALVLTAIALIPEGAHLFERSGKMALGQEAYFAAQTVYSGWAWFGAVILAALAACLTLAWMSKGPARLWTAFAAIMIALSLGIFFAFVFPANQVTQNWTVVPKDWETWRSQWEWGHTASATCTFAAFLALAWNTARRGGGA
jgi:hypothetical protein